MMPDISGNERRELDCGKQLKLPGEMLLRVDGREEFGGLTAEDEYHGRAETVLWVRLSSSLFKAPITLHEEGEENHKPEVNLHEQ